MRSRLPLTGMDQRMQGYRAYIMGPDGHVQNRVDLRCHDDVEATRLAKQLVDGCDVELWQLDRKIETLKHPGSIRHLGLRPLISDSA